MPRAVKVVMEGHTHEGLYGWITNEYTNPDDIPRAVRVVFQDETADWFWDSEDNLETYTEFDEGE